MDAIEPIANDSDEMSPYSYLLQWEWPEHIESQLRKLLYTKLQELGSSGSINNDVQESDYLAAKLIWSIAVYPQSNPTVLHALAHGQPSPYLERIAENPNAKVETLTMLSKHVSPRVRAAVADNPSVSADLLQQLAGDESIDVRYSLAENHNLPKEILERLSSDDNGYVASRANRTLNRLEPRETLQMPFRRTASETRTNRRAAQG